MIRPLSSRAFAAFASFLRGSFPAALLVAALLPALAAPGRAGP